MVNQMSERSFGKWRDTALLSQGLFLILKEGTTKGGREDFGSGKKNTQSRVLCEVDY